MDYKTTWIITCVPFVGYYAPKEVVINNETDTEYRVAFGYTCEYVLKSNCFESKELAEQRISEIKGQQN